MTTETNTPEVPARPVSAKQHRRTLLNEAVDLIAEGNDLVDKASCAFSDAESKLNELLSDFQNDFDERSEKWQESEAGEVAQERITALEEAIVALQDLLQLQSPVDLDNIDV